MPQATSSQPLSTEAQHVIDSLEAHFNAVAKAAQNQHPALVSAVAELGDVVLAKLEAWGVKFRGTLQGLENAAPEGAAIAKEVIETAVPGAEIPASNPGSADAATAAAPGAASSGSEPAASVAAGEVPTAAPPGA